MAGQLRWWSLSFAAFFALAAGWALALPVNGTYDEKQHVVRAYAVATGQLTPVGYADDSLGRRTAAFRAPRSLLPVGTSVDCTWWVPRRPASCQRWVGDRTRVLMPSTAARYSPAYYAAVGVPVAVWPDRTGITLARLVSAALSAALLAAALVVARWSTRRQRDAGRCARRRLLPAGVALVATPLVVDLAGSVNPAGLEIAAGVLVATCLAALATADRPPPRALLWLTAAGTVLLLAIRQLGPVLLVLLVAGWVVLAGPGRARDLLRRRDVGWILGGAAAAGVAATAAWLAYAGPAEPMRPYRLDRGGAVDLLTDRLPFWFRQVVAQFSYGETHVSPVVTVGWYLLWGLVVATATRRGRWAAAALVAGCVAVLIALDVHYLPRYGWFSQGRYALPAAVGAVLYAAATSRAAPAIVLATVPLHTYSLAAVMTRFQVGFGAPLDPFGGSWRPPAGPLVPLACVVVGATLLAAVTLRAARAVAGAASPARPAGTPRSGSRTGGATSAPRTSARTPPPR